MSDRWCDSVVRLGYPTPTYGRTDGLTKRDVPLRDFSYVSNARESTPDSLMFGVLLGATRLTDKATT
jgi:hypothetical protein